jgi:hypothetical protein
MVYVKTISGCNMLNNFNRGFASALIDGEGCICFHSNGRTSQPRVCIDNTNKEILIFIMKMTNLGVVKVKKENIRFLKDSKKVQKIRYCWYVYSFIDIITLLKQMKLIVKKRQQNLMVKFCSSRLRRSLKIHHPDYTENEKALIAGVKKLNSKGRYL